MSAPAHAAKENAPPNNRPPGNVPPGDAPPCIEAGLRTPGRTASGPCACTPPKHGAVAQVLPSPLVCSPPQYSWRRHSHGPCPPMAMSRAQKAY